jgi:hypothetical protein
MNTMPQFADLITATHEEFSCIVDDVAAVDPALVTLIPEVLRDIDKRLRRGSKVALLEARVVAVELHSLARLHGSSQHRQDLARRIQQLDTLIPQSD